MNLPPLVLAMRGSCVMVWSQEFGKHDKEPSKYIKQWTGFNSKTGAPFSCDVGYERFLAPEVQPLHLQASG